MWMFRTNISSQPNTSFSTIYTAFVDHLSSLPSVLSLCRDLLGRRTITPLYSICDYFIQTNNAKLVVFRLLITTALIHHHVPFFAGPPCFTCPVLTNGLETGLDCDQRKNKSNVERQKHTATEGKCLGQTKKCPILP